jgi:hypothetical protein
MVYNINHSAIVVKIPVTEAFSAAFNLPEFDAGVWYVFTV